MSSSNSDSIETAFSCIQSGNELESQGEHWEAAVQFHHAHEVLERLSTGASTSSDHPPRDPQIADLYRQQAREYFFRSRDAFISALKRESDRDRGSEALVLSTLDLKDLDGRATLFGQLYARVPVPFAETNAEPSAGISEKALQERLIQLNESLPSGFKTNEQRMADINRGLNRLGLSSIYSHSASSAGSYRAVEVTVKSESEQVDEIIQQARDELRFAPGDRTVLPDVTIPSNGAGDDVSCGTDIDDLDPDDASATGALDDNTDGSEGEVELTPEQIQSLREDAVLAQTEVSQLLVLLDPDEGGDTEIEFEPQAGLEHLRRARKALKHAALVWEKNS